MFESLYFKDILAVEVAKCVNDRYEGSKSNDCTLGTMYYLNQFKKYADELYQVYRAKLDGKPADDGIYHTVISTRSGASKIDPTLLTSEVALLLQSVASAAGAELSDIQAQVQATKLIARCTTRSADVQQISVQEVPNA